jgi:hypothetical protein
MKNYTLGAPLLFWLCTIWMVLAGTPAFCQNQYTNSNHSLNRASFPRQNTWVFILAGQSNMAGRGTVEPQDTVTSPRILTINQQGAVIRAREPLHFYEPNMKGAGCGLAFARELLAHLPQDDTILLIPTAVGGSSMGQWLRNTTHRGVALRTNFSEKMTLGKQHGVIRGILWHQGESDANPQGIREHSAQMQQLFTTFREQAGNPSLPVLIGELGEYSKDSALWSELNQQMWRYAETDSNCTIVSAKGLNHKGDYVHFDTASQRELGRRFARAYMQNFLPQGNMIPDIVPGGNAPK